MLQSRAFTIVEVLVAVALIGLLMGVLIPATASVRSASRRAGCAVMQSHLFLSMTAWSIEHHDEIPGVNTTGHAAQSDIFAQEAMLYDSRPASPTSIFDWMSPILGRGGALSINRAERTRQLFHEFACPEAGEVNAALWGWAPDIDQFREVLEGETYPQISYLSPASFHLYGRRYHGQTLGRHSEWLGPAIPPTHYRPRTDGVGTQPARKIFLADGTRYVGAAGLLDFDVSVAPEYFGSFTSSGPIYVASTAYGRSRHLATASERAGRPPIASGAPRHNRDLSYRHSGMMGTLRFDGSMIWLTEDESKADATPWYPTGSEFTGFRATPQAKASHAEGSILH